MACLSGGESIRWTVFELVERFRISALAPHAPRAPKSRGSGGFGSELRVPSAERLLELVVENPRPGLQQKMGPTQRPLHLLFFDESSADYLVPGRFDECRADRFPLPLTLAEVRDELAVIADVGSKLIKAVDELLRSVRLPPEAINFLTVHTNDVAQIAVPPENSAEHVVKFMERHLVGDRDQADDHPTHLAQNRSQNQALSSTTLEAGMLADRPCKWDLSIIDFNTKALASYPIG
jgi:hypothetical protein